MIKARLSMIIIIIQEHVTSKSIVALLYEAKVAVIVQSTITCHCLSSPLLFVELNRVRLLTTTITFSILFGFDLLLENANTTGS